MQTSISEESSTKKPEPKPKVLVSDERMEELRKRFKEKTSQVAVGVDPEMLAIGIEMAVYHIERGAYKFADYTKRMVADLGDVIRPYLKAFYNGARDLPEMEQNAQQMDSYADVSAIDVNFITIEESVEVSLELKRESRYNEKIKGVQVSVHRDMKYSIPDLNLTDVPVSGAYIKGAVDDILENVVTGKDMQERLQSIERGTKRLQTENELLTTREGKAFEFTSELENARKKVEEYTELMKKELAEKEAKYADMGTGALLQ